MMALNCSRELDSLKPVFFPPLFESHICLPDLYLVIRSLKPDIFSSGPVQASLEK